MNKTKPPDTATSLAVDEPRITPPSCIHCGAPANPSVERLLDAYNAVRVENERLKTALFVAEGQFAFISGYSIEKETNAVALENMHKCREAIEPK